MNFDEIIFYAATLEHIILARARATLERGFWGGCNPKGGAFKIC